MTVRNEFTWAVVPPLPSYWHGVLRHGQFDVNVSANSIEVAADAAEETTQQQEAEVLIRNLVRAFGINDKTQYSVKVGSRAQYDPISGTRSVTVQLEGVSARMSAHADVVVTGPNGEVVFDSRQHRIQTAVQLAVSSAANATLQRMLDFRLAYFGDPQKHLDHLFNILELAVTAFKQMSKLAKKLGIDIDDLRRMNNISNDEEIVTGRHPGGTLGSHRDPRPDEVELCERVADAIISKYSAFLRHKNPCA